jgi:hypothetical protein
MRSGFTIPPKTSISAPPRATGAPPVQPALSLPPPGTGSLPPNIRASMAPKAGPSAAPTLLKPIAIDTIIQSSTIEILHSYDITIAPRSRTEVIGHVPDSDVVGVIAFEGSNIGGYLTLAVPSSVSDRPLTRRAKNTTHAEWTYEITNQVMGNIKNRLLQFQVKLRTHLPMVLSGAALGRNKSRTTVEILYCFAALRGDVCLMVDASLSRTPLEYSNVSMVVTETDPILFG